MSLYKILENELRKLIVKAGLVALLMFGGNDLYAKDIHVPGDYKTIQGGIDASEDGDRVLVGSGKYNVNESITYRGKDIALKSEIGPENTIIRMENPIDKPYSHVFTFRNGETEEAILEGFTITGVNTGGIYCENSSPIIKGNIIKENDYGGVICSRSDARIIENIILKNSSGGKGGGIYCSNCDEIVIMNNIIRENYADSAGGIYSGSCSSIIIKNNIILDNFTYEDGGGIFIVGSDATIENNIIAKNIAEEDGGAIDSWYSRVYIIGNTITDNSAYYNGGGMEIFENIGTILLNNIVYANTSTDLSNIQPSQVFYSDISQEGFAGINGNISENPLLVNPNPDPNTLDSLIENGDYDGAMNYLRECFSLQPNSPCIDSGDPNYLLDPDGTRADIGAVYFNQDRNKFIRGDSDRNGEVNALDAVPIIYHLFENKQLKCKDSADVDDNGTIDENDVYYLLDFSYRNGNQPPAPFPEAGYDLTPDTLACYVCKKCEDADLSDDYKVNFLDYTIFADNWLKENSTFKGDIYEDNLINFKDLKNIAENWLWNYSWPGYDD